MKWAYDLVWVADPDSQMRVLNDYGQRGWELVSVDQGWGYFKRPVDEPAHSDLEVRLAALEHLSQPLGSNTAAGVHVQGGVAHVDAMTVTFE